MNNLQTGQASNQELFPLLLIISLEFMTQSLPLPPPDPPLAAYYLTESR